MPSRNSRAGRSKESSGSGRTEESGGSGRTESSGVGNSIGNYCKYKSEKNAMEKRRAEALKNLVATNRSTRDALENWMVSNNITKLYLPPSDGNSNSKCVSIRKTTSQRAINEKAVRNAMEDLFRHVDPYEEISLEEPKILTDSVYKAVHGQCVNKGQTVTVTECRRPQKNTRDFDDKTLYKIAKYADAYNQTQKQIKDKRQHYAEARVYLDQKISENENPVKDHLLQQKASAGRPVQKVTLTCEDEEPEDVSLRFQQRKTFRRTKRLGLKVLRAMIDGIIKRRTKQLEQRGIRHVKWKDFLPVLMEDLITEINEFYEQNREEVTRQHVSMTRCRSGRSQSGGPKSGRSQSESSSASSSRSGSSQSGSSSSSSTTAAGVVRDRSRKSKSSKKRRHTRE